MLVRKNLGVNHSLLNSWLTRMRRRRAQRALERQLEYQEKKAQVINEHARTSSILESDVRSIQEFRAYLESLHPISPNARILEVGSGAHGIVFFFGEGRGVGIDPLAHHYARLFPAWQYRAPVVTAYGEALPFPDATFDLVFSNNVIDHAERPAAIIREITRVLAPSGLLYFTVHVHHPVYGLASSIYAMWRALGGPFEVSPFADHTVHLTIGGARRLFKSLPLRMLQEQINIEQAKTEARETSLRHPGHLLKRVFFKNAVFELIAVREP